MPSPTIPTAWHVSGNHLTRSSESESDLLEDPRGVLWVWHEPNQRAKYIMGCDPTVGITGWTRATKIEDDKKTDNAAIEIFEVDAIRLPLYTKDGKPDIDEYTKQQKFIYRDLQVAEFAAPCDAVEIARVLNVLGRVYAGDEEDQCELIFESYPGPGMLTNQELLRLGYGNLWVWETIGGGTAEPTSHIGWRSWGESQRMLWYRSRRHLMDKRAKINSRWLWEEYSNAVIDVEKMRARASYGYHDDRIQAANMCFWAGHKWCYNPDRTEEVVSEAEVLDWQRQAPVLGEYRSFRDAWTNAVDNWG